MKRLLVTLVLVAMLLLAVVAPAFAGTSSVGCTSAAVGSLLGPNVATSSCGAAASDSP
jgi:hypothetical protein